MTLRELLRRLGLGRVRAKYEWLTIRVGYRWGPRLASRLRKWRLIATHPHVRFEIEEPVYLGPGFSIHAPHGGTLRVGPAVEFRRGFRLELAEGFSEVAIGAGGVFSYYAVIQCGRLIEIGERCFFGQSSMIVDGNHRFRDLDRPMLQQGYDLRPVRIADDVTTTTKCTIMASIGTRTFVGANSVVTRDLPPYVVAVGAPARAIDYFGPPGLEPPELSSETSGATGPSDAASDAASSQAARKWGASS